jgi:hypothetical protein
METTAKQKLTASSDIVMLIRKLAWVGLEEKAEQLAKQLQQRPVTETVVSPDDRAGALEVADRRFGGCSASRSRGRHSSSRRSGARHSPPPALPAWSSAPAAPPSSPSRRQSGNKYGV